jgi:hypothetical protein
MSDSAVEKAITNCRAGVEQAATGTRAIEKAHADLKPIVFRSQPVGLAIAMGDLERQRNTTIRGMLLANAKEAVRLDRRPAAGLAFCQLRETFERPSEWLAFLQMNLAPLQLTKVEALMGEVRFRGALMTCSHPGCDCTVKAPCSHGKPYIVDGSWPDDTAVVPAALVTTAAMDRALEAIKADRNKSNRLIAREIGASEFLVRKARKAIAPAIAVADETARIGQDGRARRAPKRGQGWQVLPPEGQGECDYNPEFEPAFDGMSDAELRQQAHKAQMAEAERLGQEGAFLRAGTKKGEINRARLKEVRRAIRSLKTYYDRLLEIGEIKKGS